VAPAGWRRASGYPRGCEQHFDRNPQLITGGLPGFVAKGSERTALAWFPGGQTELGDVNGRGATQGFEMLPVSGETAFAACGYCAPHAALMR